MNILNDCLLTKIAIYYPPGEVNEDGERAQGTPVERKCHWEQTNDESIDVNGKTFMSEATIYMKDLVKVSGWLWLSSATVKDPPGTGLSQAPASAPNNQIIKNVEIIRDIDNTESMKRARI